MKQIAVTKIELMDWINETVALNQYRGLDGKGYDFVEREAVLLAESDFKHPQHYALGVRWYALYRLVDRYIFTIGYYHWHKRREIPEDWVPELLSGFFTRNELTEQGKALLK